MKKLFILAATAALVLGACSKNEVDRSSSQTPVEFGTYLGKTKATSATTYGALTLDNLKSSTNGFGVFGYYADNSGNGTANDIESATSYAKFTPNFMYNQKVKYNSTATAWEYSPLKYWPNEYSTENAQTTAGIDKLSFTAYAPHVATVGTEGITAMTTNTDTGSPVLTFTVPTSGDEQIDLLYAKNFSGTMNLVKSNISNTVGFEFAHALSQITFKVQAVVDEVSPSSGSLDTATKITLTDIIVKAGSIYESGELSLIPGTWDNQAAGSADRTFTEIGQTVTTTLTQVKKGGKDVSLFAIPGTIASGNLKIEVKYTVTTTDSALPNGKIEVKNDIFNVSAADFAFVANKKNVVNLLLGMTSLKMTVTTIDDWGTGAETTVNLPINVAGSGS